jgi:hypothetical protein
MQRLTWNGIAFHGGPLPGYAASHGCVRMPYGFAENVFDKTRVGMRVIVSPNDTTPAELSHPALLTPSADAIAEAPARAETLARETVETAKAADEAKKSAKAAEREASAAKAALRKAERQKSSADAGLAGSNLDAIKADADATAMIAAAPKPAGTPKAERQKSSADSDLASAEKAAASANSAVAMAEERKLKAAAKAAEAAANLDAVKADADAKIEAAAKATEAAKEAATRKTDTAKAADEAKLALEPVSIYISRKTQKLYVRRNTQKPWPDGGVVYDATIEAPVTIRDPDRPIGTHVFTAMAQNDTGLRWSAVTIDNGDNAKDALDRITIPQDVLDRIAPTALPRSSITHSDEPLSRETNYRTEFVAVLSNQPQGGFITRKPTISVPPADFKPWGSGGFFSFFDPPPPPANPRRRGRPQQVQKNFWD